MDDQLGLVPIDYSPEVLTPNVLGLAEGDPVPVDVMMGRQGITAYFQFVQNNMPQVAAGNVEHVMAEAEHRHREVMRETFEYLNAEYRRAFDTMTRETRAENEQLKTAVAQLRAANDNLAEELDQAKLQATGNQESLRTKAEELHKMQMEKLQVEMAKKSKEIIDNTVNASERVLEELREEHAAARRNWEHVRSKMEGDYNDLVTQSSAQNEQLQSRIDALNEEVIALRKQMPSASSPKAAKPAHAVKEVDALKSLQEYAQSRTLNLQRSAQPGKTPEEMKNHPNIEIPDHKSEYVPTEPFQSPVGSVKLNEKTDGDDRPQAAMLAELVKALKGNSDSSDKPKAKEAETIAIPDMPTPETYRSWKNHVRELVRSASDKPDDAWHWIMKVWDSNLSRTELEDALKNPGAFVTLDTKLTSALTKSAKGDLANRILNFKEEKAKQGEQVRGRTVLLMFDDYFKTSEEAGNLYSLEDLLKVQKAGDTLPDLKRFINRWDAVIAGMKQVPEESILRDVLLRQIRNSVLMKYDIDTYDRAKEGEHHKTYKFLYQSIRDLIDRERLRENRDRIADRQQVKGPKEKAGLPAKEEKKGRQHSPSRGRTPDRSKKYCWEFDKGNCTKGKKCPFLHEKRPRSNTPGKGRGRSAEKSKKMSKEEMAKTPCVYHAKGNCRRGDKCYYSHAEKPAAAAPKDHKRTNSPAPKKKAEAKAKAAPCLRAASNGVSRTTRYACIARVAMPCKSEALPEKDQRKITFEKRVQVRKIKAHGDCDPVIHRPREYSKVYPDSASVPKSKPHDLLEAKAAARKLQEAVKMFDDQVQPMCKFQCECDEDRSLTCKDCRKLIGPQNTQVVSTPHAIASPAPKGKHQWLMDSGSEQDLISEHMLKSVGAKDRRYSDAPISLITANGNTVAHEVADVHFSNLLEPATPYTSSSRLHRFCPSASSASIKVIALCGQMAKDLFS